MTLPKVDQSVLVESGYLFNGTFTTTAVIPTAVLTNKYTRRDRTTVYCYSSQSGSLVLFDVDEDGNKIQLTTTAITANVLNIQNFDLVTCKVYGEFTPSAAPGTETLIIRGYTAGWGGRS